MSQFKHRDIQQGDTVSRLSQHNTYGITAETTRVQKIDHRVHCHRVGAQPPTQRIALVQWPSSKRAAWVLCENLVKVSES